MAFSTIVNPYPRILSPYYGPEKDALRMPNYLNIINNN